MGIVFYFGEGFAGLVLPDIVKYLPFGVANASLVTGTSTAGVLSRAGVPAPPVSAAEPMVPALPHLRPLDAVPAVGPRLRRRAG